MASLTSKMGATTRSVCFHLHYLAWTVALFSVLGSLFFSEVMGFAPCVLCWYQRIFLFPLVVTIGVGIVLRDQRMRYYSLPLSTAGLLLAAYHNLIYFGLIPERISPCTAGVSCSAKQIEWLGFITIPMLSLFAFLVITMALHFHRPRSES